MHAKNMPINLDLSALFQRYSAEFSDFDGLVLTDPNQKGYGDDAPLHVAARQGLTGDILILVRAGASVDMPGDIGCTPLHFAAMAGQASAVKLLLDLGANPRLLNEFEQTAVEVAELGGHHEIARTIKTSMR